MNLYLLYSILRLIWSIVITSRQDRTAILGGIVCPYQCIGAEFGRKNSSILVFLPISTVLVQNFGQKNSSMLPHPPLYKPIPLFFQPHVYNSAYFPLILRWSCLALLWIIRFNKVMKIETDYVSNTEYVKSL